MKHFHIITLHICLLFCISANSQTLNEIFSSYIQPHSSTEQLQTGLQKVTDLCATAPQAKCNKAKASALYLLADNYFEVAYQVYLVDKTLTEPILQKANRYFEKANVLMPIDEFPSSQQHMMLDAKLRFESEIK